MFPRINKLYVAIVALLGTAALAFVGWSLTAQVYREWSAGVAISGGWNWPIVIGVDILCLLGALGLYWKIYADSKTQIDTTGVSRPTLRGRVRIAWPEVTDFRVFRGVGYHIYAGKRKVVVSSYAYHAPEKVIEVLYNYTANSHQGN